MPNGKRKIKKVWERWTIMDNAILNALRDKDIKGWNQQIANQWGNDRICGLEYCGRLEEHRGPTRD